MTTHYYNYDSEYHIKQNDFLSIHNDFEPHDDCPMHRYENIPNSVKRFIGEKEKSTTMYYSCKEGYLPYSYTIDRFKFTEKGTFEITIINQYFEKNGVFPYKIKIVVT
jgi:hypothetical protein